MNGMESIRDLLDGADGSTVVANAMRWVPPPPADDTDLEDAS